MRNRDRTNEDLIEQYSTNLWEIGRIDQREQEVPKYLQKGTERMHKEIIKRMEGKNRLTPTSGR